MSTLFNPDRSNSFEVSKNMCDYTLNVSINNSFWCLSFPLSFIFFIFVHPANNVIFQHCVVVDSLITVLDLNFSLMYTLPSFRRFIIKKLIVKFVKMTAILLLMGNIILGTILHVNQLFSLDMARVIEKYQMYFFMKEIYFK